MHELSPVFPRFPQTENKVIGKMFVYLNSRLTFLRFYVASFFSECHIHRLSVLMLRDTMKTVYFKPAFSQLSTRVVDLLGS